MHCATQRKASSLLGHGGHVGPAGTIPSSVTSHVALGTRVNATRHVALRTRVNVTSDVVLGTQFAYARNCYY